MSNSHRIQISLLSQFFLLSLQVVCLSLSTPIWDMKSSVNPCRDVQINYQYFTGKIENIKTSLAVVPCWVIYWSRSFPSCTCFESSNYYTKGCANSQDY